VSIDLYSAKTSLIQYIQYALLNFQLILNVHVRVGFVCFYVLDTAAIRGQYLILSKASQCSLICIVCDACFSFAA